MRCKYCYEKIEEEDEIRLKKNVGVVHTECDKEFEEIMESAKQLEEFLREYYGEEE